MESGAGESGWKELKVKERGRKGMKERLHCLANELNNKKPKTFWQAGHNREAAVISTEMTVKQ